jgi:hypothetical protein
MTVGTAARPIRSSVATIGLAHTLHDLALSAANRALLIKIGIDPAVPGSESRAWAPAGGPRQ